MNKTLAVLMASAMLALGSGAKAQVHGVAVQVSNGKRIPTVEQLRTVLNPGDFVRDVLGWHRVDKKCNLRSIPGTPIVIPPTMATLYANVQAAGGKNFVTLAFNNKFCGQPTNGGGGTFPNNALLIAEFAAYAAAVVKQVPALGGVSLWNELNGTWNGGYSGRADKLRNYCKLANAVIGEIRRTNPNLPIAIGASIGWDVDEWFIEMFGVHGCVGKGDPLIWLDVHPYLSGKIDNARRKTDWTLFREGLENIRADGITNPLVATEWGAKSGYTWLTAHPKGDYMKIFDNQVTSRDANWAGLMWYEMLYDKRMPNSSLFDSTGSVLTPLGRQYVSEFRR